MKNTLLLTLLFVATFFPQKSLAWGPTGHEIVAKIAFKFMDRSTKKQVLAILDGMSAGEAANWMDAMRKNPEYNYMKPYHYVNFEKGNEVSMVESDNAIYIIDKTIKELQHKETLTAADIKIKVLMLFHLIGDLHMPLHVGYGEDKGGNSYQVNYLGKGTNLHGLWDFGIIDNNNIGFKNCLNIKKYSKAEVDSIQNSLVLDWSKESRSFLDAIYDTKGTIISEEYVMKNIPIIESRIQLAGIRLAGVLQSIFKN
jgi:hypothetical protein